MALRSAVPFAPLAESAAAGAVATTVDDSVGTDPSQTIVRIYDVSRLGLASYFLALIFLCLTLYSLRQLRRIFTILRNQPFEPSQIFHTSVSIHCGLRFLSFGVLSLFSLLHMDVWYPALVMLFTVPEFLFISLYLLLYFVWVESYIFAHDQFVVESRRSFRRGWVVVFFLATLVLYGVLCALYILLILRTEQLEDTVVELILWAIALGCLILPVLMLAGAAYFGLLLLSGNTFSSELAKKRVAKVSEISYIWTFGRIVRGVLLILSNVYHWQQSLSDVYLQMGVVSILLVTEVLPLLAVLDWSIIGLMLWGDYSDGAAAAASTGAGRGLLSEGMADEGQLGYSEIVGEGTAAGEAAGAQSRLLPPNVAAGAGGYAANGRSHHHHHAAPPQPQQRGHESAAGHGFQIGISDVEPDGLGGGLLSVDTASMYDHDVTAAPTPQASLYLLDMRAVHIEAGSERLFDDKAGAGFSTLHRAVYHSEHVVVKSFLFPPAEDADDGLEQSALMQELLTDLIEASAVSHPNVVRFIGVAVTSGVGATTTVQVVTEWIAGGSLRARLSSAATAAAGLAHAQAPLDPLPVSTVLRWALEIASGMEALHARHIVHGHLSSAHIMIDAPIGSAAAAAACAASSDSASVTTVGIAKVSDVGSRRLKSYAEVMLPELGGTGVVAEAAYGAPELLQSGSQAASAATDVYAFAVCCWEMATRQRPWEGRDPSSIYTAVVSRGEHLRFPSSNESALPPSFSKLVASCWQADATARPTFTQIVQQLSHMQTQTTQSH